MTDNMSVMNVKILKEAGFEEALMAIALNKKKYDKDMYPISKKLAVAGGGHDKFLSMIGVWLDYTTTRSIHQQIDTYCVGTRKSSESTHHRLIEDVLETCINRQVITDELIKLGYTLNEEKCTDGLVPINNTALLISKIKKTSDVDYVLTELPKDYMPSTSFMDKRNGAIDKLFIILKEYFDKYFSIIRWTNITKDQVPMLASLFVNNFKINYDKYYEMFEGGSEAITIDTINRMVEIAMTIEEDRIGKLHKLKRMLPEGFLQRRIMFCNYQVLRTMLKQRFQDPFVQWQEFVKKIILQVEHPEYFVDILEANHTSKEELSKDMCNGKPYGIIR